MLTKERRVEGKKVGKGNLIVAFVDHCSKEINYIIINYINLIIKKNSCKKKKIN